MAKLHFKRIEETLTVTFAEQQAVVPWSEVALNEQTAPRIYPSQKGIKQALLKHHSL